MPASLASSCCACSSAVLPDSDRLGTVFGYALAVAGTGLGVCVEPFRCLQRAQVVATVPCGACAAADACETVWLYLMYLTGSKSRQVEGRASARRPSAKLGARCDTTSVSLVCRRGYLRRHVCAGGGVRSQVSVGGWCQLAACGRVCVVKGLSVGGGRPT